MSDVRQRTGRWANWQDRLDNWEREYLEEYRQLQAAVKLAGIDARRIRTRAASRSKYDYKPRIHRGEQLRLDSAITDPRHSRTEPAE